MQKDIDTCNQTHSIGWPQQIDTIYIGWKWPLESDGAYKESVNLAWCESLFWDSDKSWLKGYIKKIRTCNTLHAKYMAFTTRKCSICYKTFATKRIGS
jgi:hypothetical protein